jgi:hypothetical protein
LFASFSRTSTNRAIVALPLVVRVSAEPPDVAESVNVVDDGAVIT